MPTVYTKSPRRRSFTDINGLTAWHKDEDSVETYTIDWSDELGSETVSTSTWLMDGPTNDSDSSTTTTTSITVSKSGGTAKNTITTSGGRTLVKRLRFVEYEA